MIGVPPHPKPWPTGAHFDAALLEHGDARNVVDRYRYWRHDAITADLRRRQHPFHVAIENFQHDFNIGTVVRCANAFLASGVHIVGKRRWNRRGAMMTEQYLEVRHHPTVETFVEWAGAEDLPIVGVDNLEGSVPLEQFEPARRCVFAFGQEGPGLSEEMRKAATTLVGITQFGSTRSINAGVAGGIVMHHWVMAHGDVSKGSV